MATNIRLVVEFNALCFPAPADQDSSLLIRRYPAGDCDSIPWPMVSDFATLEELRTRLAIALYDERESNDNFPEDAIIELPDGTVFDFDALVV